jgi:hypothetical protein
MSETGQPRPGRISGENLPFATGRGEPETEECPNGDGPPRAARRDEGTIIPIEEEADTSSTLALVHYRRERYRLEPEDRLKHWMAIGLLILLGLVLLTILVGNIIVTMNGRDAASLNGFGGEMLRQLFPMLTLVVGYIFGRQAKLKTVSKKK